MEPRTTTTKPRRSNTTPIRPVPAVGRAIAILRLLSRSTKPLGVSAISRELRMVPSTCLYIIRALVREEFLAVNPATMQYTLDAGIMTIARQFLQHDSFRLVIQPRLDLLADRFGVTAVGVKMTGLKHMTAVAVSRSDLPGQVRVEVGSHYPALIGASGRCVAAFGEYPRAELERHFRSLRWYRAPTLKQWRAQIEFTKKSGYAIDQGNYFQGLTVVSVPILDENGLVSHTVDAVGVSVQITKIRIAKLAEYMRATVSDFRNAEGT